LSFDDARRRAGYFENGLPLHIGGWLPQMSTVVWGYPVRSGSRARECADFSYDRPGMGAGIYLARLIGHQPFIAGSQADDHLEPG
jgi:hypothetical protein